MDTIDPGKVASAIEALRSAVEKVRLTARTFDQLQNQMLTLQQAYGRDSDVSPRPGSHDASRDPSGYDARREQIGAQVHQLHGQLHQLDQARQAACREHAKALEHAQWLLQRIVAAIQQVARNIAALSNQTGRPQQWLSESLRVEQAEQQRLDGLRAQLEQALAAGRELPAGPPPISGQSGLESRVGSGHWHAGAVQSSTPSYFSADRVYARTSSYSLESQLRSNPYRNSALSQSAYVPMRLDEVIRDDHYRRYWDWNHPMNSHKREVVVGMMRSDWRQPAPSSLDLSMRLGNPGSYGPMVPGPSSFDVMTMNLMDRLGRYF